MYNSFPQTHIWVFPKHTPFQSTDDFLARLSCKVPFLPPSYTKYFLPFRSSPTRISPTGLKELQGTIRLRFGVTGRDRKPHSWAGPFPSIESVASGQHYAYPNQLSFRDPNHLVTGNLRNHLTAYKDILNPRSSIVTFPPELKWETSSSISKATTKGGVMIRRFP